MDKGAAILGVDPPGRVPQHLPGGSELLSLFGLKVRFGHVPEHLPNSRTVHGGIEVNQDSILVRFTSEVRLLVSHGRTATLCKPDTPQWQGDSSWLFHGWAMSIAAFQRGMFSIHASTVDVDGRALAIAGRSGAGKSTTAMSLRNRGHTLLVDDLSLIEFRQSEAWVLPFPRNVHLLPDSADALGLDFNSLPLLAGGRTKAAFVPEAPARQARRLDAVIILEVDSSATAVQVRSIDGLNRVLALDDHTIRAGLAPRILGEEGYFWALTSLARACPLYAITRPAGDWTMGQVLDILESIARDGGLDRP